MPAVATPQPYSSYACSQSGYFTAWWSCPAFRPSTTTWPKGGERQSCISVPYSRRCNHDSSIRPAKSVSGGRAEREVTWAIKTWFNVAAVGWVGREVRLCWVTFDNRTHVVGRESVQRGGNRICRRSRETKHAANTQQRLMNEQRHQNQRRGCVMQPRAVLLRLKKSEQFYSSRLFL